MSNDILKYVAIFTAGVGVGVIAATAILKPRYDKLLQEEIDRSNSYESTADNNSIMISEINRKRRERYEQAEADRRKSSLDGTYTNQYNEVKRNYRIVDNDENIEEDECDEEGEDDSDIGDFNDEINSDERVPYPYVITDEEFSQDNLHYDKVTLYYYAVDDTLVDTGEEIMDDIEDTIGYDSLNVLDMQTTVWVRNERLGTDYEVCRLNQSFEEQILGVRPENRREGRKRIKEKEDEDDDE